MGPNHESEQVHHTEAVQTKEVIPALNPIENCTFKVEIYNPHTSVGRAIDQQVPCDSFIELSITMSKSEITRSTITEGEIAGLVAAGVVTPAVGSLVIIRAIQTGKISKILSHLPFLV